MTTAGGIFSTVIFTPVKNGEYRIHIKLDGVDISGSPFRSHAIDGIPLLIYFATHIN